MSNFYFPQILYASLFKQCDMIHEYKPLRCPIGPIVIGVNLNFFNIF